MSLLLPVCVLRGQRWGLRWRHGFTPICIMYAQWQLFHFLMRSRGGMCVYVARPKTLTLGSAIQFISHVEVEASVDNTMPGSQVYTTTYTSSVTWSSKIFILVCQNCCYCYAETQHWVQSQSPVYARDAVLFHCFYFILFYICLCGRWPVNATKNHSGALVCAFNSWHSIYVFYLSFFFLVLFARQLHTHANERYMRSFIWKTRSAKYKTVVCPSHQAKKKKKNNATPK